jgi:hypothetical protein
VAGSAGSFSCILLSGWASAAEADSSTSRYFSCEREASKKRGDLRPDIAPCASQCSFKLRLASGCCHISCMPCNPSRALARAAECGDVRRRVAVTRQRVRTELGIPI